MRKERPQIFITNDDGIHAPGIKSLVKIVRPLGDIVLVAPDRPQSGMSHAITLSSPLRFHKVKEEEGYRAYVCSGTPVDCVKLGLKIAMDGRKPSLLLSGINHGSNASTNMIYSGTMAAALEGAMEDIPSIGLSLLDYALEADFEQSAEFIKQIIQNTLAQPMPLRTCLNVNIPNLPATELKGIKVCRQAMALWKESYEMRKDPFHANYYWLTGEFHHTDLKEDTDLYALDHAY
ncbi:MAG: 5'/3'-nucleotidase SurE, partial [Bacteroidales bacterium]